MSAESTTGRHAVVYGGSWYNSVNCVNSVYHFSYAPYKSNIYFGFRIKLRKSL